MIRIQILLKNVRIIEKEKKESGLRALFFFFNNKMEHPQIKSSLIFLIILVTSKLSHKITQLPQSYVTSDKHNVRLI